MTEDWDPPVINTLPSLSRVAVCKNRGVVMLPVRMNVPGDCAKADDANATSTISNRVFIATLPSKTLENARAYW